MVWPRALATTISLVRSPKASEGPGTEPPTARRVAEAGVVEAHKSERHGERNRRDAAELF